MAVEVYDYVGGEKLERLIAQHVSVQSKLASEIEKVKGRAERQLAERASRRMSAEEARKYRRGRPPAKLTTKRLKIDHHVFLEGPVAGSLNKSTLSILRDSLGG